MAQINLEKIKKIEKNRNTVHDKVFTTYTFSKTTGVSIYSLIHMARLIEKTRINLASLFNSIKNQHSF